MFTKNHTLCAETGVGPDAITWEGGGVCFVMQGYNLVVTEQQPHV